MTCDTQHTLYLVIVCIRFYGDYLESKVKLLLDDDSGEGMRVNHMLGSFATDLGHPTREDALRCT
jgi:hypothetical protein